MNNADINPIGLEQPSKIEITYNNWKSDIKDIRNLIEELVRVTKKQQGSDTSESVTVAPNDNDVIDSNSSKS